jgi:hypothetical protein
METPTTRYDILNLLPPGPVIGVEVGTDTGINARELLMQRPNLFLWTVDPYLSTKEFPEVGRVTALRCYEERVWEFVRQGRTKMLKMKSVDGAKEIKRMGVVPDFIYIDGDHGEEAVKEDLAAWFPLLRPGGLMAGHDFDAREVHTPVIKFCMTNRLELYILNELGDPTIVPKGTGDVGGGYDKWGGWAHPSFFFFKP